MKWWNLQCYDGGDTNKPQDWRDAIIKRIPDFNTDRFILASDWSRFKNNQGKWHDLAGPLEAFQVASGFGGLRLQQRRANALCVPENIEHPAARLSTAFFLGPTGAVGRHGASAEQTGIAAL